MLPRKIHFTYSLALLFITGCSFNSTRYAAETSNAPQRLAAASPLPAPSAPGQTARPAPRPVRQEQQQVASTTQNGEPQLRRVRRVDGIQANFPLPGSEILRPYVQAALERSSESRSAELALQSREAEVSAARAGYFPTFSSQIQYAVADSRDGDREAEGEISANQPIFDWGAVKTQVLRSQEEANSARFTLVQRKEEAALQAVQAYIDVHHAERRIKVAEENITALQRIFNLAERRLEAGASDTSERDLVGLTLDQARSELEDQRSQLNRARTTFRLRVGRDVQNTTALRYDPAVFATSNVDLLASNAPSVRARSREAAALDLSAREAELELLPRLNARGVLNANDDLSDIDTRLLFEMRGPTSVGLGTFRRVEARRQSAAASRFEAEAQREELVRRVREQSQRLPYISNQITILDDQIARAEAVRDTYEQQFVAADRAVADILTAQSKVHELQGQKEDMLRERLLYQYQTLSDLGLLRAAVGLHVEQ
ncbi:TolC family protein [Nitratireductor basaltis]|nr:TolC family protein [Nitratireductor basaltis]